jgi:cytochrome P450
MNDPVLLDAQFIQDPHGLEALLRDEAPVRPAVSARGQSGWLVTRYADVRAVLTDQRVRKDADGATELLRQQFDASWPGLHPAYRSMDSTMLNTDPPDHTRLRKLVNKAFTTGAVARLRPRIEAVVDELLDGMAAGEQPFDLIEAFALPLPMTVICELLGVPDDQRELFRDWSNTLVSSQLDEKFTTAVTESEKFLNELVERKREQPGTDLLSNLVNTTEDGDRLTQAELVSMSLLLLIAGHDTTVNLIGNGVLALLREPEQLTALRADPSLVPNAVEEFLRFNGPVHVATLRYTVEPIELGGVQIPADQFVMVSLLSANRDGQRFDEPDRLDVTRPTAGHVAFGHGIHHCLGAPLARLEAQIALGHLIERFPELRLAADPASLVWRPSTLMRGLQTLPVAVR